MKSLDKNSAFTLIELVVIVTILSLLSTIGLISYIDFSQGSRDSVRITELRNIQKSLELSAINEWKFPLPDNSRQIKLDWSIVWYQWTFWDNAHKSVKRLSKKPLDPLLGIEYSYSLLHNTQEYQVSTIFEGETLAHIPWVSSTYAAEITAYSIGNYNERVSYINDNWNDIILALPSITSSDINTDNVLEIIKNNNLVINGKYNLPYLYNSGEYNQSGWVKSDTMDSIIFSGNISELNTYSHQRTFLQNLKNAYSEMSALSEKSSNAYETLNWLNLDDSEAVQEYINFLMQNNIGGLPRL